MSRPRLQDRIDLHPDQSSTFDGLALGIGAKSFLSTIGGSNRGLFLAIETPRIRHSRLLSLHDRRSNRSRLTRHRSACSLLAWEEKIASAQEEQTVLSANAMACYACSKRTGTLSDGATMASPTARLTRLCFGRCVGDFMADISLPSAELPDDELRCCSTSCDGLVGFFAPTRAVRVVALDTSGG